MSTRCTPPLLLEGAQLFDGESRTPPGEAAVLVVDGYEQLGPWGRFRLKRFCRRRRLGLVVTAHASVNFPELFHTISNTAVARLLVDRLLVNYQRLLDEQDVSRAYARQEGNIRELLFDLYDVYESRRRRQISPE